MAFSLRHVALALAFVSLACAAVVSAPLRRVRGARGIGPPSPQSWAAGHARLSLGGGTLDAVYVLETQLGTQRVALLVDTGSSLMGLAAVGCKLATDASTCASPADGLFDPSHTSVAVSCTDLPSCVCRSAVCMAEAHYLDKTAAIGTVYTDSLLYDSRNRSKVFFAAVTRIEGHFSTALVHGIIGLSYPFNTAVPDVLTALRDFAGVPPIVALCLADEGGFLSFGGHDPSKIAAGASLQWAEVVQPHTSWMVSGHSVDVDGDAASVAPISGFSVIVDSGTTLMLVPSAVRNALVVGLRRLCSRGPSLREFLCGQNNIFDIPMGEQCLAFSLSVLDSLPPIRVNLLSDARHNASIISVAISPRSYIRYVSYVGICVCSLCVRA